MIRTGKDGYVNGVPCLSAWGISRQTTATRYAASCTMEGTNVTKGNINVTGQMSGIGGNPAITWGADMAFKGVVDGSVGTPATVEGNIRVSELTINIPKEAGTEITWEASFGFQGDVTEGTTQYTDSTLTEHLGATIAADATFGPPPEPYTFAAIPGFRSAKLTIRRPEKTYVQNGVTYRLNGNFEAEATVEVFSDDVKPTNDLNMLGKLRLYIDATNFWEFNYMRISEFSGFVVNRATQDLIGYSINYMWSAVGGDAGATAGRIKTPGGTYLVGSGA